LDKTGFEEISMAHKGIYRTFAGLTFLTAFASVFNVSVAQSAGQFSAFTSCVDSGGTVYLCTQHSRDLAMGYSSGQQGNSASLLKSAYVPEVKEEECSQSPTPSSLEISLSNPDLIPGDRIYLDDFIIEAFDENGNFLPEVPVLVWAMAQEGMLESNSNSDYVEIYSYGSATFAADWYCSEGTPPVTESFILTIN
jgi:hypothetical protein